MLMLVTQVVTVEVTVDDSSVMMIVLVNEIGLQ